MNLIIRNLLHVLRRFKLAAILNILGLSVAFAAFMIIMMQLKFDFTYDRFHENSDKIFMLEYDSGWGEGSNFQTALPRPFAELFFDSSPHIVAGTITNSGGVFSFRVEGDNERNQFRENATRITPDFMDVFTFDIVGGNQNALKAPNSVMIPLSLSQKIFGNESAIGKRLVDAIDADRSFSVGAVYRDFPTNSVIRNNIFLAIPEEENKQSWNNNNYMAYIRVNNASNVPLLFENFRRTASTPSGWGEDFSWEESQMNLRFVALPDIRFSGIASSRQTSKQTLMILFSIGIIIVVIAGINFTNFSTALTPMRIRNINTQRVLGAQQNNVCGVLIFEAIAFALISYLVALLLVELFIGSTLVNLLEADVSFSTNLSVIFGTALVAVLVGVIAGLYPAFYMTSFAPALALKGNFGLSPKGKKLRNTLIGVQFIASFALIIGASFMYLQNHFMQNSHPGYDTETLLTVDITAIQSDSESFAQQLSQRSTVESVSFAANTLMSGDGYMSWWRLYKGESIFFEIIPVHYAFLDVVGIDILEGRNFRREDMNTQYGVFLFNETARREYDLEIGSMLSSVNDGEGEIVGFVPDIKFTSFRRAVAPMALYVWGISNWGWPPTQAYIRLAPGVNTHQAVAHIRATLAEFDPIFPFQIRFFDEVLQRTYEREIALSTLILIFSLITILISIVGVFGLVVFDSECRRKEIGIRKVLGASVLEIIAMFNKAYVKILLICFVIAAPLAWYAVSRWLENFAYRTQLYWWVFLLAFVAVAAITILTVTIQNWRVANDDPVRSVKTE